MKINHVLVDYENVQPPNLYALQDPIFRAMVFIGCNQSKVPFEFADSLQQMGDRGRYIKIENCGSNSLDFHLAFYIGQLSQASPDHYFHIISKDTGYDPLVKHLKSKQILIQRHPSITDIPLAKALAPESPDSTEERIKVIIEDLSKRGNSRPRTVTTLSNSIHTLFSKKLAPRDLDLLMKHLEKQGSIVVNDSKVTYRLPASA